METSATETFLVERYCPGIDEALLRDALTRLEQAVTESAAAGTPAEHLGSLAIPNDQVVFSLMRAANEDQVRDLNTRAHLPVDRISEVTSIGFEELAQRLGAKEVIR
jgi:hypothetical protein